MMKSDRFYYTALGISIGTLIAMMVVAWMPSPKTELVCGGCGSPHWYSILAEGGK